MAVRFAFDTCMLVAGLLPAHPDHFRALPWLERASGGELAGPASLHP